MPERTPPVLPHHSAPHHSATRLRLRRVESEADRRAILRAQAAAKDGKTIAPTHIMERAGVCVGYFSLNAIPILTGWLAASQLGADGMQQGISDDEATAMFALIEDEAAAAGLNFLCAPCTPDCRFKDKMAGMGYHALSEATLNFKRL